MNEMEITTYEALIDAIDTLIEQYNASAVAIDGMSGAGMRELAAVLSRRYGAPVIHMEDFWLPLGDRPRDWEQMAGGEVDFARFREEIAEPWLNRTPLVYSIISPANGELIERRALPDAPLYIVEGTYSLHPVIPDFYDLRIFMKCTADTRLRVAEVSPREAEREDAYFLMYMTEQLSDMVLDENFRIPPLEE